MRKVYPHENLTIVHTYKNLVALNGIGCLVKNAHYAAGGHVGWEAVPIGCG
jgi:hypothetical protein